MGRAVDSKCPFYNEENESKNNIFFSYAATKQILAEYKWCIWKNYGLEWGVDWAQEIPSKEILNVFIAQTSLNCVYIQCVKRKEF